jgi:hypothetical protein
MALSKQNLLSWALAAAVAYEMLSLLSYALREAVVPLPGSLKNHFPEYLAVTLSRCVGCQECQQIFVPSGHFLILERAKNLTGLSQVNKVDDAFLYWIS